MNGACMIINLSNTVKIEHNLACCENSPLESHLLYRLVEYCYKMGRLSGSNPAISETPDSFSSMNERPVDDISLEFFYKPHTVTLLTVSIASVIYTAFTRNDVDTKDNIWAGMCCVVFFFLIISVLAFPNGPFVRPHPAVWRMVFGLSVLYLLALLFLLFQRYSTVRGILVWMDPKLQNFSIDMEKEYGVNCSDITWERVWSHVDVFAWAHFLGWIFKAVLVRHFGILWTISVMWEFTEIAFAHLLPNFVECWWDALVLDILLCNGLGIWVGLWICRKLEMREYKWVSIKDIHSTGGKIKRAVLQFTPESWTQVRWLDPASTYMRFFAVTQMVVFWQVSELNTFFLKHVFEMPPSHPLVVGRLIFIGTVVAPSVRQYYTYVTDSRCRRVGTQCWVYGAIMFTEAVLCIKNGLHLFGQTQVINIILWLLLQFVLSVACVYSCLLYHRHFQTSDDKSRDSSPMKSAHGSTSHLNQLPPKLQLQVAEDPSGDGSLGEAEVMAKAKIPEHLELRHRQRTEINGMLVQ